MAVAIVQEGHVYEFDASVTVTLSSVTAGNLLLAFCVDVVSGDVGAPDTVGGGWTLVPSSSIQSVNNTNLDCRWYYATASGGETSVTLQKASSTSLGLQVYELSGAGTPDTAATSDTASSTTLASGSVTGTADGMVFAGFAMAGLPGSSPLPSYSNSYVADISANVRIQAAHITVAGSTSTTITTQNSNVKVSSIFNVPAGGASATVTPAAVAAPAAVPSPSLSTGSTVSPSAVAAASAIDQMGAETSSSVTATAIAAPAAVSSPALAMTAAPASVAAAAAIDAPTIGSATIVSPAAVSVSAQIQETDTQRFVVWPTYTQGPVPTRGHGPIQRRLMRHMNAHTVAGNIYILNDGTVTETDPDGTTVTWDDVSHAIWGGHDEPLTSSEASLLVAAGYSIRVG